MNAQNVERLKGSLKNAGFDTRFNAELEAAIEKQYPEFRLKTELPIAGDKMEYELYFRRSDTEDWYFFNKYDATLKREGAEDVKQTFYNNQYITAKESYNLLSGRAVYKTMYKGDNQQQGAEGQQLKEGDPYKAWVQLNFAEKTESGNYKTKLFNENYGYDLEAKLKELPIGELGNPGQAERLMKSLAKGNLARVTIEKDGKQETVMIEANPQFKTLNAYDSNGRLLGRENLKLGVTEIPRVTVLPGAAPKETASEQSQSASQQQAKEAAKQQQAKNVHQQQNKAQKKTSKRKGMRV